jgi:RimJ/RimL family protein N-acetyltransferase
MIVFNNTHHGVMIAAAIPRMYNPAVDIVISRVDDVTGRLLGGVIYDGFTGNCVFIHQAGFSKRWLTGDMLWVAFDYPFRQLGVNKLAGTVPASNTELVAFNERLGFKEECRIKGAYRDGDMIVMTMERANCKWLKLKPKSLQANH